MSTTNRLPKVLQRLTELGIVITTGAAVALIVVALFSDAGLQAQLEFTPDQDTYTLASETWGTGTIHHATGAVTFTEKDTVFVAFSVATILSYTAAALALLAILRRILQTGATGTPFAEENANRIRAIGILIPVFGFLIQGLDWATSLVAMNAIVADGLHIEANLTFTLNYLFIGLVIVALSEAFRHGTKLQTEADLTV